MCKLLPLLGWIHFWGIFILFILLIRDNVAIVVLLYMLHQPCTRILRWSSNDRWHHQLWECVVYYGSIYIHAFSLKWRHERANVRFFFSTPTEIGSNIEHKQTHERQRNRERKKKEANNQTKHICLFGCCCTIHRASRTATHKHPQSHIYRRDSLQCARSSCSGTHPTPVDSLTGVNDIIKDNKL